MKKYIWKIKIVLDGKSAPLDYANNVGDSCEYLHYGDTVTFNNGAKGILSTYENNSTLSTFAGINGGTAVAGLLPASAKNIRSIDTPYTQLLKTDKVTCVHNVYSSKIFIRPVN